MFQTVQEATFFSHVKLLVFLYPWSNGFTQHRLVNKLFIQVRRFSRSKRSEIRHIAADDDRISTLVRGGPNAHVLTSWLQILSLERNDQGTYTCIASNSLGKAEKSCTVTVQSNTFDRNSFENFLFILFV